MRVKNNNNMELIQFDQTYIDLLTSLGFQEYDRDNENHVEPDIDLQGYERLFIEEDFCRQRIFVALDETINGFGYYVHVLNDIGCGSTLIPFQWSDLSADWLTHLKIALSGHGFVKGGKPVTVNLEME